MKRYLTSCIPNFGTVRTKQFDMYFLNHRSMWLEKKSDKCTYNFESEYVEEIVTTPVAASVWRKYAKDIPLSVARCEWSDGNIHGVFFTFANECLADVVIFETLTEMSAPWILEDITRNRHYHLYTLFQHVNDYARGR